MNLLKEHKCSCLNEDLVYDGRGTYRVCNTLEEWEQPILLTVLEFALILAPPVLVIVFIILEIV